MHAVMEILDGPLVGRKINLSPGETFSVGRTAKSQLILAHDGFLSGMHFLVECGHDSVLLRDCSSSNGTFVNGNKVNDQLLNSGDEILAGQTRFRVDFDAAPPQLDATRTSTVMLAVPKLSAETGMLAMPASLTPAQAWMSAYLRSQPVPVYALLDPNSEPRVQQFVIGSGEAYDRLIPTGPYLVKLQPTSPLINTLLREGWSKGWTLYLSSPRPFAELAAHLRLFAAVTLDNGMRIPFRFHDPRLLQYWLAGCSVEELAMFFGPILSLAIEDAYDGGRMIEYRVTNEGLGRTIHTVG